MTEKRNINTGGGNYNERIEGDYIQGNSVKGDTIIQGDNTGVNIIKGNKNRVNITHQSQDDTPQLIEFLRQEIKTLKDQVIRDEALEHLKDFENEVDSSDTKESRLKASLTMLWNIGKDIVMFANAVTALAVRFNIQLPSM